MAQTTHPSKEQVRHYMQQRMVASTPPASPAQIRQELGWRLIDAERRVGTEHGSTRM